MSSRMRRLPAAAAAAVLLATAITVSGCTGPAPAGSPASSPAPPNSVASTPVPPVLVDGLGLEILQNRPDYGNRVLQLSVTNEGAEAITVVSASFDSPQFEGPAGWAKPTEVPPGLTRHLPVALPPAVCPAPAATATLSVTVTEASGASRVVAATPADPFAVLPRIAGEDCLGDAVAAVAEVRLDDALEITGTGGDAVAHLRLVIDPSAGSGSLRLDRAQSTILLEPADGADWPLDTEVTGGEPERVVVLDAVPARCDPHAVAEDKRGTFVPVDLAIEGGASGTLSVRSSDALRLALYDFIADACGYGTAGG